MSAAKSLSVFVAGGTSNTGAATIQSLLAHHPSVTIKAGMRDAKKAAEKFPGADAKRLSFVTHDVKDGKLTSAQASDLTGVDTLVLVPPQVFQDRIGVVNAYIAGAKAAGIKHIVFVSTPIAQTDKLILGKGVYAAEQALKASGISTTYLQAVFFYENAFGNAATIKSQGAFYYPAKGVVPVAAVAIKDIGEAAANVVVGTAAKHGNKTYRIAGPALTWDQVARVHTQVLGRHVRFVSVSDADARTALLAAGLPQVFVDGLVELHHHLENSKVPDNNTTDLQALLNAQRPPTTFHEWFRGVSAAFGPVPRTIFVAGANGNTAGATVQSLLRSYPTVTIKAGVREVKKAEAKLAATPGAVNDSKRLQYVEHDVQKGVLVKGKTAADNAAELKGVDTLVVPMPTVTLDRLDFVKTYADAAKAAGVKHIVYLTGYLKEPLILANQMTSIDAALKASGVPTTTLALAMFIDNLWGAAATIKSQGVFSYSSRGTAPVLSLSVADIGDAAAVICVEGAAVHGGKTLLLGGSTPTWDDVAQQFTRALGKPVKYVQIPADALYQALTTYAHFPDLTARGLIELFGVIDKAEKAPTEADTAVLEKLLLRKAQTYEEWITPIAAAFK